MPSGFALEVFDITRVCNARDCAANENYWKELYDEGSAVEAGRC